MPWNRRRFGIILEKAFSADDIRNPKENKAVCIRWFPRWSGLCFVLAVVALAPCAWAQRRPQPRMTRITITGTVGGVRGTAMQLRGENGRVYLVQIGPRTNLLVAGPVPPSQLRRGLTVRFTAEVDSQGKIVAPVKEVEIFTVDNLNRVGAQVEKEPSEDKPGTYLIAGRLTRLGKNVMFVSAPVGRKIRKFEVPLAPEVKVMLAVRGPAWVRMIRPGSSARVEGQFPQFNQQLIYAQKVDVTLPQQLPAVGQGRKKRGRKAS